MPLMPIKRLLPRARLASLGEPHGDQRGRTLPFEEEDANGPGVDRPSESSIENGEGMKQGMVVEHAKRD